MVKNPSPKPARKVTPRRTPARKASVSRFAARARNEAKLQRLIRQNRNMLPTFPEDESLFSYNRFGRLVLLFIVSAVLVALARPLFV